MPIASVAADLENLGNFRRQHPSQAYEGRMIGLGFSLPSSLADGLFVTSMFGGLVEGDVPRHDAAHGDHSCGAFAEVAFASLEARGEPVAENVAVNNGAVEGEDMVISDEPPARKFLANFNDRIRREDPVQEPGVFAMHRVVTTPGSLLIAPGGVEREVGKSRRSIANILNLKSKSVSVVKGNVFDGNIAASDSLAGFGGGLGLLDRSIQRGFAVLHGPLGYSVGLEPGISSTARLPKRGEEQDQSEESYYRSYDRDPGNRSGPYRYFLLGFEIVCVALGLIGSVVFFRSASVEARRGDQWTSECDIVFGATGIVIAGFACCAFYLSL